MLLNCWLDMKIDYYMKLLLILNNLEANCGCQVNLKTTIN